MAARRLPVLLPVLGPLLALGLALGCDPVGEELLASGSGRGDLADFGPFGAMRFRTQMRVRADQALPVDVYVPLDGDVLAEGPFPPVVIIQGGLVSTERYRWLAIHATSRGFVALAPAHLADLAFFEQGNGIDTLRAARSESETGVGPLAGRVADVPGLITGHSLGGVVAVKGWLGAPDLFSHVVLLASLPDASDDIAGRSDGRVVSLTGSEDGRIAPDEVLAGAEGFAASTVVARIEGMNHYQLTDDASEADLASDGEATVPDAVAKARTLYLFDAALDELTASPDGVLDRPDEWPGGIEPLLAEPLHAPGEGDPS